MSHISLIPFIDFLRKSGLEISLEEEINAQRVFDLGIYNVSNRKLRHALKAILVRRREYFETFNSCYDIFFSNIQTKESNLRLELETKSKSKNDDSGDQMSQSGQVLDLGIEGSAGDFGRDGQGSGEGDRGTENEEKPLLGEILQNYLRWLPETLHPFATEFILKNENEWNQSITEYRDFLFGYGQYRHTKTIAERMNRFSSNFTRSYSQLVSEIKESDLEVQIRLIEHLELLKSKIQEFLRKIRLHILQSDDVDPGELLRNLYSGDYIPQLKDFLNDDFNRIEGDMEKVQRYLLHLGKKIAIQERRKRIKSYQGKINFRKTIRRNLSVGGSFLNISFQKKKRKDPKIILVSDVSGSTEWISEFFFVISYAAQSTFKKMRLFEFDNTTVEITKGLNAPTLSKALLNRIQAWENPPRPRGGHSNYQTSFEDFYKLGERYFSKNTNVLILGDCRDWLGGYKKNANGDYYPESKLILDKIITKVKRVIILNPEPKERWNTGDSVVSSFEESGAQIFHVENIMDLMNFIFKKKWFYYH